ncbi:MAG: hypothetical protein KDC80_04210 [Saprospiraceae bacterium]|nr:hypothetical protein [Saprospiraceae bacterium]
MKRKRVAGLFWSLVVLSLFGCRGFHALNHDFQNPVDTSSRAIERQQKKVYEIDGIFADNRFDGARLNNFSQLDSNRYQVDILPENEPINPSPWYAFKIWSEVPRDIQLIINYDSVQHRYRPWLSSDGLHWQQMDSLQYRLIDEEDLVMNLSVDKDTLWVSAQELQNSHSVEKWCREISNRPSVDFKIIGKSLLGRDLVRLQIGEGERHRKPTIVILSRQHPPEVTGYFAMQAFVEELLSDNPLSDDFRKRYQVLVYPLLNPDGVDMGHWRHNGGGIDLNRDWAYYRQPETRNVADDIVKTSRENKSQVILGLDFHSTWYDIFYTNSSEVRDLRRFKDYWIFGMRDILNEPIRERSSEPQSPVSKSWFYSQFGAVGITYEIGDNTPRDLINEKGKVSAQEMMKLLIFND